MKHLCLSDTVHLSVLTITPLLERETKKQTSRARTHVRTHFGLGRMKLYFFMRWNPIMRPRLVPTIYTQNSLHTRRHALRHSPIPSMLGCLNIKKANNARPAHTLFVFVRTKPHLLYAVESNNSTAHCADKPHIVTHAIGPAHALSHRPIRSLLSSSIGTHHALCSR